MLIFIFYIIVKIFEKGKLYFHYSIIIHNINCIY